MPQIVSVTLMPRPVGMSHLAMMLSTSWRSLCVTLTHNVLWDPTTGATLLAICFVPSLYATCFRVAT